MTRRGRPSPSHIVSCQCVKTRRQLGTVKKSVDFNNKKILAAYLVHMPSLPIPVLIERVVVADVHVVVSCCGVDVLWNGSGVVGD